MPMDGSQGVPLAEHQLLPNLKSNQKASLKVGSGQVGSWRSE